MSLEINKALETKIYSKSLNHKALKTYEQNSKEHIYSIVSKNLTH